MDKYLQCYHKFLNFIEQKFFLLSYFQKTGHEKRSNLIGESNRKKGESWEPKNLAPEVIEDH